jgi:type IX secretion system PorP/SprF family membrane protein
MIKFIRSILLITLFVSGIQLQLNAQVKQISTHFNVLKEWYNPAFYGIEKQYKFVANYRTQWTKLDGVPQTINFLSSFALPKIKSGIGINITHDRIGAIQTTTLQAGYNYIIPIKDKLKIGIGAQAGFEFSNLDGSKLITPNGNYSSGINHNDDVINQATNKTFRPLLNVGISLNSKHINVGVAYLNAINNKLNFDGTVRSLSTQLGSVLQTSINSEIKLPKEFKLIPAIVINTDFVNVQTDVQILAGYKYFGALGVNVRGYNKKSIESVSPIIKITPIKNIGLGFIYSYDVNINALKIANSNTHEITIFYNMNSKNISKHLKFINNPRFL